jgi:hypothetical protein
MSENRQDFTSQVKRIENLEARAAARSAQQSAEALWQAIQAVSGQTQAPPHSQTAPAVTLVAALVLWPRVSGLFEMSLRTSWSDGTTADSVTLSLYTKQGAGTGVLAGGTATGKGSVAQGYGPGAGMILNFDATGAGGLTFEGSSAVTIIQHADAAATLTGLLTANGLGTQNFETGLMLADASGPTNSTRTPFTIGKPALFALGVSATHVISFESLSFWARELPNN